MKNKVLKRGFELLRTRPLNEKVLVSELEYGIELPPIFRNFTKIFDVSEVNNHIKYIYNKDREQYCAGIVYFPENYDTNSDEVMFHNFHSLESTISGFEDDDDWAEAGYLPIAMCGHSGAVLLGTRNEEKDCIFIQTMSQEIYKISSNIFDFVRDLVMLEVSEEELYDEIRFEQLYKNWGEDFWRVRNN
ncbi:SMI1/KNR4 family protein [Tenacibaculum sp. S7007]|uniref:SMI1/KNR4 family protein n=1 Tax=Tenacibaculum pelagium TaxID=2759527 RepID=A0A839AQQ9_9FLAO|nr:SMI1/KNR4 family protein [Tenacibaculum pelagium]MBA6156011.1 SMI1/KNR4 family protein [Tenacibaculum pelagium]